MAARPHSVGVIIAAGGSGLRMGGRLPKQFLRLAGKPVLAHAIAAFHAIPAVKEIVVVAPSAHLERTRRTCVAAGFSKVSQICAGGRERQDSVWNGLRAFTRKPDIVLVHDAVRPFVSARVIKEIIRETVRHRAAVVGVRVKDTIKLEERKGYYTSTLDRRKLWGVQTPQGFRFDLLVKAHERARKAGYLGTDEASLVERLGIPARIVEGDYSNIKITTPDDLKTTLLHRR